MNDAAGYRLAVGAVGLALIVVLTGACVIVAVGKTVPQELWTIISALGGGLLGILAPAPTSTPRAAAPAAPGGPAAPEAAAGAGAAAAPEGVKAAVGVFFKDMFNNRTVVILLGVFIFTVIEAATNGSPEWNALAAASGGALVGLLGPSPAK
ncbi:MAG: hypothetical protein ACHQAV_04225 [Solirubrobacterales bacterium]